MDLTACMMIANEEYWIYYILRELAQVFPVLVYDTGSTDKTCEIIKAHFPEVELVELGPLARSRLGSLREEMFDKVGYPAFKVDGDEYYPVETLKSLKEFDMPDGKVWGFSSTRTLGVRPDGRVYERAGKSTDCVFLERVSWGGAYPYEGHSLWGQQDKAHYFPSKWWGLHLHHLERSSLDATTLGRAAKKDIIYTASEVDKGDVDLVELVGPPDIYGYNPYLI